MRLTIISLLFVSHSLFATVRLSLQEVSLKERAYNNDILLDEKNFWHARKIFKRLGEFGIELNDKGRCKYLTRRKLLKYGSQADWDCFFAFRGMVREIQFCAPENWNNEISEIKKVRGLFRYVGVAPLPYRYDLVPRNGKMVAESSIYYRDFDKLSEGDQKEVKNKIRLAVELWNSKTPEDLPYEIKVTITDDKENAHFKINITHGWTRGPYLREHSVDWSYKVYAHEIGHMLGLDDEYDQIFGTLFNRWRCNNDSMMCSHHKDGFPRYYWYLIFRRAQCV